MSAVKDEKRATCSLLIETSILASSSNGKSPSPYLVFLLLSLPEMRHRGNQIEKRRVASELDGYVAVLVDALGLFCFSHRIYSFEFASMLVALLFLRC